MTTYDDRDLADDELAAALGELARSLTGTLDVDQALDRTRGSRSRPSRSPPRRDSGRRRHRGRARSDGGGDGGRPSVRPHPGDRPRGVVAGAVDAGARAHGGGRSDRAGDDGDRRGRRSRPCRPPRRRCRHPRPTPARYDSTGGSISVRMDGGVLAIDGEPRPTPGWSVRVDDDGPTRVRVRFERDDRRSEIRIDLVDGRLEPRITDG